MGPQNGLVGQDSFTEVPQTQVPDEALEQVRNLARYSQTREFQNLKEYLEQRIDFFKAYQPNGDDIRNVKDWDGLRHNWIIANTIIAEFKTVLSVYEQANNAVREMDNA